MSLPTSEVSQAAKFPAELRLDKGRTRARTPSVKNQQIAGWESDRVYVDDLGPNEPLLLFNLVIPPQHFVRNSML